MFISCCRWRIRERTGKYIATKNYFSDFVQSSNTWKNLLFAKHVCARNSYRNIFFNFEVTCENFRNLYLWSLGVKCLSDSYTHNGGLPRRGDFDKFSASIQQQQRRRTRYQLTSFNKCAHTFNPFEWTHNFLKHITLQIYCVM